MASINSSITSSVEWDEHYPLCFQLYTKAGNPVASAGEFEDCLKTLLANLKIPSNGILLSEDVLPVLEKTGTLISPIKNTLLHVAAGCGNKKIVHLLLHLNKYDLGLLKGNNDGNTALHLAASSGHTSIVKLLNDKYPQQYLLQNNKGNQPLQEALINKRLHAAKYLINHQDNLHSLLMINNQGKSVLYLATETDHAPLLKLRAAAQICYCGGFLDEGAGMRILCAAIGGLKWESRRGEGREREEDKEAGVKMRGYGLFWNK